jgi:hypothetical protein
MKRTILVVVSLLLLSLNFLSFNLGKVPEYNKKEFFEPSLGHINSIDKLTYYIDSLAAEKNIAQSSVGYAVLTESVIKKRFYHGFSHYGFKQNWIAAVSEKMVGYGLSSIVNPNDIIKHPFAACSQQALVMSSVLKRKGYSYRSVGFPHHYAMEFLIDNQWYYFDPNMEPSIPDSCRIETKWECLADNLKKYYDTGRFKDLDWKFGKSMPVFRGQVNASPAPHATVFQTSTQYLSKILWVFPMVAAFYPRRKTRKKVVQVG